MFSREKRQITLLIDNCQLRKQEVKSFWSIRSVEKMSDTLGRSENFTTIETSWRLYQLSLAQESQDFNGLSTIFGCFKRLKMHLGLIGCRSTFPSLLEEVLDGLN